ncbi:transmembrane protein 131-like isoform X1 [Ambystoma mexicanum]|uniref:transmembrane protein 131-like isoform X1 n=1 Tax=Ambystoma mexicanum TaxID=8296 RepID=UPI0037E93BD1
MAGRLQQGSSRHSGAATHLLLLGALHLLRGFHQAEAQQQVADRLPSVVELWPVVEEGEPMLSAQADEEHDLEEPPPEQSSAGPSGRVLHLQPSVLDFGAQQLGMPRARTLHAYNPSRDTDVFVDSVFTACRHFHVSPFQNRVIPAKGTLSFRVVFLPSEEGNIESSLFINTSSHGVLPYQVFGVGTSETFRDYSENLLGNAELLFPQIDDIQLSQTKVDTSNTSLLQVRLKCDVNYETHRLPQNACFAADHTLRLQMSLVLRTGSDRNTLETLKQYILDNMFVVYVAVATNGSAVNIYVLNSGKYLVHIQNIYNVVQREMLSVNTEPILLLNSPSNFTKAGSITCGAASRKHDASCLGEIRMNLLGGSTTLQACLSQQVTEGFLGLDPSAASFHIQPHHVASGVWSIWLTNNFDFSIVLHDAYVAREARNLLKIVNFTGQLTLPPGCWNVFSFKLNAKESPTSVLTNLYLATNLGVRFEIPLQIHTTLSKQGNVHFEAIAQCGRHSYFEKSDSANLRWQKSLSLDRYTWNVDFELGRELYERYWKIKYGDTCRKHFLIRTKDAAGKKPEEGSFAFFWPRLISKPGLVLNFSTTALKNSTVRYFTLRNPSSSLVAVQLLPLSSYPAPHAAMDLLSKWFGINVNTVNFTTDEFRLSKECTAMDNHQQDFGTMKSSPEVLYLNLQPWEIRRIGVKFSPADNRKVTTLIMIRNNLTILDVVTVEGLGAKESLKVGGRLPGTGGSLRFKVPESTLMDCRQQLKNSKHILSITKIFKVENIGPVPITISSMKINGYTCQGFGFEVLDCHAFFLDQNSSREISIVFIPDFTSSWVIRELTLVTASDLEFHFTLNVTLPHHLLPLCADGVPGPSWEESFWMLTVLCVSLSLLGVVLIAFQQAQYILTEFMKSRCRQSLASTLHQNNNSVDTISSESYRGTCKAFVDSCSPPDKGKGKGFLSVSTTSSRNQNASKRSPATYSHSQKKHKCSVYYSKQKASSSVSSSAASTPDDKLPQLASDGVLLIPKDECLDNFQEKLTNLTYVNGVNIDLQKHLTLPGNLLEKEELALKNTAFVKSTSLDADLKEDIPSFMFPKETNIKTVENVAELREPVTSSHHSPRKTTECFLSRGTPPLHAEIPATATKNEGHSQQVEVRKEKESCEATKRQPCSNASVEKMVYKAKEIKCCGRPELQSTEQEDASRKKRSPDKRDGNLPNLNWNKNRTSARRNRKKNANVTARATEQIEVPHLCSEFERPELRISRLRSWYPAGNGDVCKNDQKPSCIPMHTEPEVFHSSKQNCREKCSSDSSSDCGSSRGSVRASRGSWGSWSSTSSSDGDKRPLVNTRNVLPSRENMPQKEYPAESPVTLNLTRSICNKRPDMTTVTRCPEPLLPPFPDAVADPEKTKGLYPTEDIWATQPICLTSGLNYNLGNNMACMVGEHPSVQNSFMDWNAPCEGQFSNMYGHLETNDYGTFQEENMNYPHHGFPCPEVQNTAFIDHGCQSSWSMSMPAPPPPPPPSMPVTWEPTSYVSSSPYLSSTRSLSPMSGLFGSIWAPQNDMYDGYCPISPTTPHAEHVENQAVMCKQEYSPRFNPFNAYMNLDIWTTAANRNANFPLSRDSGYCGNV